MRILIRNNHGRGPVKLDVNLEDPPTIARPGQFPELPRPVSLDWDRAVDDELHLRRCPVCGCGDLYARKPIPQLTGFMLIMIAAIAGMALYGTGHVAEAVIVLAVLILLDLIILIKARRILICYRCGTEYHRLKVPKGHPGWNAARAEYP